MKNNGSIENSENIKEKEPTLKGTFNPFETIIDNLPFSCWLKDKDGNYLAANKTFADCLGIAKDDIIGKNDFDIFEYQDAENYSNNDKAVLNGEEQETYEFMLKGQWKEEYKKIAYDRTGGIIGVAGFTKDITEQKKVEEALRESERGKAVLLSNLPGVAYRCMNDENWTMTFLSEGCLELTGYRSEELIDSKMLNYYLLIDPEFREKTFKKWEEDVEANLKSNDEYIITTKSGEKKWVWEQSIPVQDGNGDFSYSEGFILDITNIKEAEKLLRESEDRFRTIFEKAPLGIGIFDSKTGCAYQINSKLVEILGRTPQELFNSHWKNYSCPDDIEENMEKLNLLKINENNGFSMNKRFFKPDGSTLWVNMVVAHFESETVSDKHLCMVEDITLSKKKEQEVAYLSYHDILTGLYNRTFFEEEEKRLDLSRSIPLSVIMCDVNGLKLINDSFGHPEGDKLLKQVAEILEDSCGGEGFIARIGGDEFVILLDQTDMAAVEKTCERIYKGCRNYEKSGKNQSLYLSISLGHATKTHPGQSIEGLLKEAEDMLYKRKNAEKKTVRKAIIQAVKNEISTKSSKSKEQIEGLINIAVGLGQKLNLSTNKLKELELLMELYDIGELVLNEGLSLKDNEILSKEELVEYQKHPEAGYRIALGVPELKNIAVEILCHHEHWDGSGYPKGIKGERIPLLSRIAFVIDSYDKLKDKRERVDALEYIKLNSGTYFDPKVVNAFTELISGGEAFKAF